MENKSISVYYKQGLANIMSIIDKNRFNNLLSSAGYSLSKNNNFDLVISYCIENDIYDINIINEYLYTYAGVIL